MFTGIVETLGRVVQLERSGGDASLSVEAGEEFIKTLEPGASVLVAGVCLTATRLEDKSFTADVSSETLACTTLGGWREGEAVNLERALRFGDSVDGHLVSGHVDAVARVVARVSEARSERFEIETPAALAGLIAPKGAVCLDGVSLTVNDASSVKFNVNIIPHTLESTTFSSRRPGDGVNLEVDLLARYVERCLARRG